MTNSYFSNSFIYKTGERIIPGSVSLDVLSVHYARYFFASKFCKDKIVLNVASGSGYGSEVLINQAKDIFNIDISRNLIFFGNEKYGRYNNHFLIMDAQNMDFPNNFFDIIVSFETLEHLPYSKAFLKECSRVLKTNGLLIISTPNKLVNSPKSMKPYNHYHFRELGFNEWKNEIAKNFKIKEIYGQEKILPIIFNKVQIVISDIVQFIIKITPGLIFKLIKTKILKFQEYKISDIRINKKDNVMCCNVQDFYLNNDNKAYQYIILVLSKK